MTDRAAPTPPLVDLDELSLLIDRCRVLAQAFNLILSGSGLPDGPEKTGLLYELGTVIEESAQRAGKLSGAL